MYFVLKKWFKDLNMNSYIYIVIDRDTSSYNGLLQSCQMQVRGDAHNRRS